MLTLRLLKKCNCALLRHTHLWVFAHTLWFWQLSHGLTDRLKYRVCVLLPVRWWNRRFFAEYPFGFAFVFLLLLSFRLLFCVLSVTLPLTFRFCHSFCLSFLLFVVVFVLLLIPLNDVLSFPYRFRFWGGICLFPPLPSFCRFRLSLQLKRSFFLSVLFLRLHLLFAVPLSLLIRYELPQSSCVNVLPP